VSRLPLFIRIVTLLSVAPAPSGALHAQTRSDTLAVLHAIERALHVPLAKPGAEGHYLIVGVSPGLSELSALVSETFGQLCVEGSRLTASMELNRFVLGGDTAQVKIRTTDGSGTSGTLDDWRLRRDASGRWEGAVATGGAWEGEGAMGPTRALVYCRGKEPG